MDIVINMLTKKCRNIKTMNVPVVEIFNGYNHSVLSFTSLCCDLCYKNCDCGNGSDNHSSFVFIGK